MSYLGVSCTYEEEVNDTPDAEYDQCESAQNIEERDDHQDV